MIEDIHNYLPIIEFNSEGDVTFCNALFLDLAQIDKDECMNIKNNNFINSQSFWDQAFRGESFNFYGEVSSSPNKYCNIEVCVVPLPSPPPTSDCRLSSDSIVRIVVGYVGS